MMNCIANETLKRISSCLWFCATLLAVSVNAFWADPPAGRTRIVQLTEYGFEPKSITLSPGPVNFVVRSKLPGRQELEVRETDEAGANQRGGSGNTKQLIKKNSKAVGRDRLVLTPGVYELFDRRFSQWKCVVRVR